MGPWVGELAGGPMRSLQSCVLVIEGVSGSFKTGRLSVFLLALTASKAAKKLDNPHFKSLPKMMRKKNTLGRALLALGAGGKLSKTLWSIWSLQTLLAFALLVELLRQTLSGEDVSSRKLLPGKQDWMADFGPQIDAGNTCSKQESNRSLTIKMQTKKGKHTASAGLYLSPPPPNIAHIQSPPPTLTWYGPIPGSWQQGSNRIAMLPVDCAGSSPDKCYCCAEVRKLLAAFRGAGVTTAHSLNQCMVHAKALLRSHVTFDALNYCQVDLEEYVSPKREDFVLAQLQPEAYGHRLVTLKDDEYTIPDHVTREAR